MLKTTRVCVRTWGRTPFQNAVFKLSLTIPSSIVLPVDRTQQATGADVPPSSTEVAWDTLRTDLRALTDRLENWREIYTQQRVVWSIDETAEALGRPRDQLLMWLRSADRRVGKECRSRWSPYPSNRRRHTRYWRDWSSDVCSSDLRSRRAPFQHRGGMGHSSDGSSGSYGSARELA